MNTKHLVKWIGLSTLVASGWIVAAACAWLTPAFAADQPPAHVFELRTYYAAPGKLDALHARFRDHTNALFEKHGMRALGYWVPIEQQAGQEKLVYILQHDSKEAADSSWDAFRNDSTWMEVKADSETSGKLVDRVESTFLSATDYSPIK